MTKITEGVSRFIEQFGLGATLSFGDQFAGLEDLMIITNGGLPIAIPFNSDPDDVANAQAVAVARQLGLRSVDYARRAYIDRSPREQTQLTGAYAYLVEASSRAKTLVKDKARSYYSIRDKPDHAGVFAAGCALLRLVMTFRTAVYSLRQGMHFEFGLLGRLILEQVAWAYAVHSLEDDTILQLQPQKQIGALKEIFPDIGAFYGSLSKQAHIAPQAALRYLDFTAPSDPRGPLHYVRVWRYRLSVAYSTCRYLLRCC